MKINVVEIASIIVPIQISTQITENAKNMRRWSITPDLLVVGIAKMDGKGDCGEKG